MDIIPIYKDEVPYEFSVNIDKKTYEMTLEYNTIGDFFTLAIIHNNEVLVREKIVYGKPLFTEAQHLDVPNFPILPFSFEEDVKNITFENFYEEVYLFILDGINDLEGDLE